VGGRGDLVSRARGALLLWAAALTLGAAPAARPHPGGTALLQLVEAPEAPGTFAVTWSVPERLAAPAPPEPPELPARCRRLADPAGGREGPSWVTRWRVACGPAALAGATLALPPAPPGLAEVLVRTVDSRGVAAVAAARAGAATLTLSGAASGAGAGAVLARYGGLGVLHILGGLDHVLFVLALLLACRVGRAAVPWRLLLATVTAFTLAHSVTLAAAAVGWVGLPPRPVEALIALSVLLTAAEVARAMAGSTPSRLVRRPWQVAFPFGLLHGLGFAGALRDIGLPADALPTALLSFNLGVEVGQLAILAVALAGSLALRPLAARAPLWARQVPIYAIGAVAGSWTLARVVAIAQGA
jgi:hypothetical protein